MSWTTKKIAEETGLTDRYIRYLIDTGKIEATKEGRDWLVDDDVAEKFIAERKAQQASES